MLPRKNSDRLSEKRPGRLRRLLGVAVVAATALVMTTTLAPGASAVARPGPLSTQQWHSDIAQLATPAKGCFTATYPNLAWHSVGCTKAPSKRYAPPAGASGGSATTATTGPGPETVGNGVDFSAQVTGLMTGATGSFPAVAGVTSETSLGTANSYSLQLNSKPFPTTMCSITPGCSGWEQFIYSNPGSTTGYVFIQFWLENYLSFTVSSCPSGWIWAPGSTDCYVNGSAIGGIPSQAITNLGNLNLTGTVTGGTSGWDTASLSITGTTTVYSAATADSTLDLSTGWTAAEFAVVGDGNSSQAVFNPGSTITVQTVTHNGTTAAPTCISAGYTGETNNLNLVGTATYATGASPSIRSVQSNIPGPPASCAASTGWGEPHIVTFDGMMYDFQALGTFTEAQTASMTVQAEQITAASTWPGKTVNTAVATRMGSDTVAVCGLTNSTLVVDGATTTLASGSAMALPSGDTVSRTGNIYTVTDPQGDTMQADATSGAYITLNVGLGTYPEPVSGLLANAPGNPHAFETSTGVIIPAPLAAGDVHDMYTVYGDSWRVSPSNSLVAVCGIQTSTTDPTTPAWANTLPQSLQAQSAAVCQKAEVTDTTLLEACTLDVAVLGGTAVTPFIGKAPPLVVGWSEDTGTGK
jgi:von Willebrand factor type D domain